MADREVEAPRVEPIQLPLDPTAAVGPGKFDPAALLVLWVLVRCAHHPDRGSDLRASGHGAPVRVAAGGHHTGPGLACAPVTICGHRDRGCPAFPGRHGRARTRLPLSRRATGSAYGPDLRRPFTVRSDRLHLVRAYRSLRWTTTVRTHAAGRIGRWGRALRLGGPVLLIADIVLVMALLFKARSTAT